MGFICDVKILRFSTRVNIVVKGSAIKYYTIQYYTIQYDRYTISIKYYTIQYNM